MHQNTKIVATVGPACSDYEVLLALAKEGVHVFRLNFSHGTHEEHKEVINHILRINQEHDFHVGILADLQGPKIRIGNIESKEVLLESGKEIIFTTEKCPGTAERVYISYENFPKEVKAGERILLDDGKLVLEVVSTDRQREVRLKIIFGGVLSSKKGVNLPDTALSIPCITEKDLADLDFILTQPVNWIADVSSTRFPIAIEVTTRVAVHSQRTKVRRNVRQIELGQGRSKVLFHFGHRHRFPQSNDGIQHDLRRTLVAVKIGPIGAGWLRFVIHGISSDSVATTELSAQQCAITQ